MHVIHLRRCVEDMLPRTMPRVARGSATLRRAQMQPPVECQKPSGLLKKSILVGADST
jgi:hypothetical protein